MRLFKMFIGLLVCTIITSCSETESDGIQKTIYVITIDKDSLFLSSGSICSIDFQISSSGTPINLNTNDGEFTIELVSTGLNKTLTNYKLSGIEQTNGETGNYRAYIEDLNQKNNYNDDVQLVLIKKNSDKVFPSPAFNIRFLCDSTTKNLLDTGLILVQIETINQEEPVCDYVPPPSGCWGAGTKNATKVPGKIVIMKDSCVLYNSGEYDKGNSGMTLKIRGNTSAYPEKKPYKIKLQKKADLLSRENDKKYKDKDWILLKYNGLKTLVGFKINELMDMQWTPSFQFVNVMVNGDYRGLYMLTESVKRNTDCRLDVSDTGYVLEYDAYWWNEDVYFVSDWAYPMNYTFKYPDEDDITQEQMSYIKGFIDILENVIKEGGPYEQYIDVDSWARWLLSHDILGTYDSGGSNVYLTKYDYSESTKLMMANLWDFDTNYMMGNKWARQHDGSHLYFYSLLGNKNEVFKNTYKTLWSNLSTYVFDGTEVFLTEFEASDTATSIDKSIIIDNRRWNSNWPSISEEINIAASWFSERQIFLNTNIPNI